MDNGKSYDNMEQVREISSIVDNMELELYYGFNLRVALLEILEISPENIEVLKDILTIARNKRTATEEKGY